MIHKGEVIEKAIRKSGFSITKMAQKLGKSRRWMYLMFDNPNVDSDTIAKIGTILHYDFFEEIKNPPNYFTETKIEQFEKLENTVLYWKEKYYALLEEYHELIKRV